jgi:hypothetical protein
MGQIQYTEAHPLVQEKNHEEDGSKKMGARSLLPLSVERALFRGL